MPVAPRLVLVVALLASAPSVLAQEPRQTAAPVADLIIGRVVDDANAVALRRVRITSSDRGVDPVYTNGEGRFEIRAAGRLRLSKPGFVPLTIDQEEMASGSTGLTIRMVAGAAVTGTVFEPTGFPAVNVRVRVRRLEDDTARRRADQYTTETDDRGEFRVGNLPAGRYEIDAGAGARGRGGRARGRRGNGANVPAPPGVTVAVRAGEESAVALVLEPSVDARAAAARRPQPRDEEPAADAATIRGRVVNADGSPLEGALVDVIPVSGGRRRAAVATDPDGRYEVTGLAPGAYRLRARRSGYSTIEYGQHRSLQDGKTVRLPTGSTTQGIDFVMPRGGVITGRVTDPWGEPLEDVEIQAMQARWVDGRTTLSPASVSRTDDRGRYRIHGLLPGTYYLMASGDSGRSRGREDDEGGQVFYPGTPRLTEALPVRIDTGQDGIGLDMVFAPPAGVEIRGLARSSAGAPVRGRVMLGVSARYGAPQLPVQTANLDREGAFEFSHVPPGDYVIQVVGVGLDAMEAALQALRLQRREQGGVPGDRIPGGRRQAAATAREFGAHVISVAGEPVNGLAIDTSPGSVVSGEVVLEGDPNAVQPSSFTLTALPADPDQAPLTNASNPRTEIRQDWSFELNGLTGPSRFALSRAPEGWWLKSVDVQGVNAVIHPATFGRREHSSSAVRVVIADGAGRIDGQVVDERHEAVTDFAVVVFPPDPARWFSNSPYLAFATATQDGSFSVSGLPPGEYLAAAVDRIDGGADGGEWERPDVLASLAPLAERVEVGRAQPVTTNLRLIRLGR